VFPWAIWVLLNSNLTKQILSIILEQITRFCIVLNNLQLSIDYNSMFYWKTFDSGRTVSNFFLNSRILHRWKEIQWLMWKQETGFSAIYHWELSSISCFQLKKIDSRWVISVFPWSLDTEITASIRLAIFRSKNIVAFFLRSLSP
jgi:hypothetical protein